MQKAKGRKQCSSKNFVFFSGWFYSTDDLSSIRRWLDFILQAMEKLGLDSLFRDQGTLLVGGVMAADIISKEPGILDLE